MTEEYAPVARLIAGVRSRWRRLILFQTTMRSTLLAAAVLCLLIVLARLVGRTPWALAVLTIAGLLFLLAGFAIALWSLRRIPSDARLARFIEERHPALDERLMSAVSLATLSHSAERPAFAESMIRDAARAAAAVDAADIVPAETLRRAGIQAAAAILVLALVATMGRHVMRRSFDAATLALFPSHIQLEVTPGNARILSGAALTVEARLAGNRAPVVAQLLREESEDGNDWRATEMEVSGDGRFALSLNALARSFRYRVIAAGASSPVYTVAVVRPPRVKRIDVEYHYPKPFGLPPRTEKDGGDIYAPAGTEVRLSIHTDAPAASGRLVLGSSEALSLAVQSDGQVLTGSLKVTADSSYRVSLADREGLASEGQTEYFIRMLDDRPPEVHVVRPASDRRVTPLEEVEIEAQADDDFGVASLALVYAVRGGAEKVVPLRIPAQATSVTSAHTLYLEDLVVRPGDFVSYYVRARDLARGKGSSEARSDIFFLEIKPFEEEFTLAQSQAAMGGGASNPQIDDLVAAQKEIIVATWKLDRRGKTAGGAKSAADIKAVAAAEDELKTRVEQTASALGTSRMRQPRRPAPAGRGVPPAGPTRAGQTLAEEDAMTAAATAMAEAVGRLNALKTADAIGPEMEALNQLLRAQADVKRREVQRQQAGGGGGGNRPTQDLSSLFDKELARHQQTNYETPQGSSSQDSSQQANAIDKIKDLAQRQDELTKRQQELAQRQDQLSPEERKRQLERLTRDQNELRQRAEELAQQLARQQSNQQDQQSPSGQQQSGQQPGQSPGQPSQPGQSGQSGRSGQQSASGQQPTTGGSGQSSRQLREISEEMRSAAGDLRREDADQASGRAARAVEKLRDLERQMEASTPDGRRRALGDLQLEARQLADAERKIAAEAARSRPGEAGKDTLRRLAGEQDRLAERLRRVQDGLERQERSAGADGRDAVEARRLQQSAGETAREIDRQRIAERMEQSANAMRSAAGESGTRSAATASTEEEIARSLERIADRLSSGDRPKDDESRKLAARLDRVQELRQKLDDISQQLERLNRQAESSRESAASGQQNGGRGDPSSSPQSGNRTGSPGQGGAESAKPGSDVSQLREQAAQEMQEVRELLDQLRREDSQSGRGGSGRTFEGQGMITSAPGTEGFKQDFAKWQELTRQVTAALDAVEASAMKRLQAKEAKDRLVTGIDDDAPARYQDQVDSYFRALATRKKP